MSTLASSGEAKVLFAGAGAHTGTSHEKALFTLQSVAVVVVTVVVVLVVVVVVPVIVVVVVVDVVDVVVVVVVPVTVVVVVVLVVVVVFVVLVTWVVDVVVLVVVVVLVEVATLVVVEVVLVLVVVVVLVVQTPWFLGSFEGFRSAWVSSKFLVADSGTILHCLELSGITWHTNMCIGWSSNPGVFAQSRNRACGLLLSWRKCVSEGAER